jgi:hypothetical protein
VKYSLLIQPQAVDAAMLSLKSSGLFKEEQL